MILFQRWEPIISASFPSQIPFWITLKGIPLHYWHEKVVKNIGMELGQLDTYEVTRSAARVHVTIDGLKPLIKSSVLDFDSGEESIITMEYEKLGNHCSICNRLSHLRFQCPDRPMDLPTAPMAPPHGNLQSNDLHATRDYSTKTASSKRPNREPEFH